MTFVDGNALAGALALAFGCEMTGSEGVCGACGLRHGLAEAKVYLRCPGMVMRCPRCRNAEIVIVEIEHQLHLTVRGLASITFRSDTPDPAAVT